ncbi:MAG: hypothetical protein FWH17_10965 [Oscillospiraceae bacterium]|nr:hypothetical protein [Oscillospiraceae bacterium]
MQANNLAQTPDNPQIDINSICGRISETQGINARLKREVTKIFEAIASDGADFSDYELAAPFIEMLRGRVRSSYADAQFYQKLLNAYDACLVTQKNKKAAKPPAENSVPPVAANPAEAKPPETEHLDDGLGWLDDEADTPAPDAPAAAPAQTAPPPAPSSKVAASKNEAPAEANQKLSNSVNTILEYAEADEELCEQFTSCVKDFTAQTDRSSGDDDVRNLRRDLTKAFYAVYRLVFMKSLNDKTPPTVINMFLNFGYVDAALSGADNAEFLFSIADSYKGDPQNNVYTIREWLTSIYEGKTEPSLSEFDMDYAAYVRDLKNSKQIDAAEEKRLLSDVEAKLNYEMDNAFPVVNRVTFGNPSRFCPAFADHNIQRGLKETLVTPEAIGDIIKDIRNIDFSAFYRETAFADVKLGISGESINVEVLPNIILMPNVGLRGSMWQDVERRIRATPARMFLPVFLESELNKTMIGLVADFRWEICRRVQGSRWNDVTDPSLTSYFCDYLQFYMNNRNISMQTMTEIRQELSSARNNYKKIFASNYTTWILSESRGMARLNNIALGILMTFCPFTAEIRERLKTNMRFGEALTKYNAKRIKREQRLVNLAKKLNQTGKGIPDEIKSELEFIRR